MRERDETLSEASRPLALPLTALLAEAKLCGAKPHEAQRFVLDALLIRCAETIIGLEGRGKPKGQK